MSYSIIRVAKVKGKTNTTGIQKHVQRENKNYENLDIDLEKSHLNYDLVNDEPIEFNSMIDEKIEENYTGNRKYEVMQLNMLMELLRQIMNSLILSHKNKYRPFLKIQSNF